MPANSFQRFLTNFWAHVIIVGIVIISFAYYAPCFFYDYTSDNAIQSLMSTSFDFKRDFFYWGQNRLGSFLPMVTYLFFRLTHFHPLYLTSVIHYALLLISGILISTFIQNNWIKIAVFIAIFLPVTDYRAMLFIGHPYSVQLFCGSVFLFTMCKIYSMLVPIADQAFRKPSLLLLIPLCLLNALSFCIGVWASELSVILLLIPIIGLLFDRNGLLKLIRVPAFYSIVGIFSLISIAFFILFYEMKKLAPEDEMYDHPFFFSSDKIVLQFSFLKKKFDTLLLFKDNLFYDNLFYYLLCFLFILSLFLKRDRIKNVDFSSFYKGTIVTLLFSFVLLFFSTWNLRSEFGIRYYTPLYFLFMMLFFIAIDKKFAFKKASAFGLIFILFSSYYSYDFLHGKNNISAFAKYKEFSKLPQGTLIAGYWDTYLISSVAYKNLTPLTFDNQMTRNAFMIDKAMENKNFYFINNEEFKRYAFKDTLKQFNRTLVFTGQKYICNGQEVLCYRKL